MALNYTYQTYTHNSIGYSVLSTKASNLYPISLRALTGTDKYIKNTEFYGMNACFFNTSTSELCNIAYSGMGPVGPGTQGSTNAKNCGAAIVCWDGSKVKYYDAVTEGSDSRVPKNLTTWAQGGISLYLCDTNWESKFKLYGDSELLTSNSPRTGIMINENTNMVYLFITTNVLATVAGIRSAMMNYANIVDGGNNYGYRAILTDGGRSAQMHCAEASIQVPVIGRAVPEIIALRNKT